MSFATEAEVQRLGRNFAAPAEVYERIPITAPCPAGHADAEWTSERIGTNQGRTLVDCRVCS